VFTKGMIPMRHLTLAMTALSLLLLGGLGLVFPASIGSHALAQDADPFAGVTIEAMGGGASTLAADRNLVLLRITMEPGANIPPHRHPGEVVLYVDSGTFGTTFVDGTGTITRATTAGTPAATESVSVDTENILNEGDSLVYSEAAAHTMANPGDEPLVLLVSAILSPDMPGFMFMDMDGTPTP
jgi:mannose-6-phosphate isomerase-like protein (cupin superfamily)